MHLILAVNDDAEAALDEVALGRRPGIQHHPLVAVANPVDDAPRGDFHLHGGRERIDHAQSVRLLHQFGALAVNELNPAKVVLVQVEEHVVAVVVVVHDPLQALAAEDSAARGQRYGKGIHAGAAAGLVEHASASAADEGLPFGGPGGGIPALHAQGRRRRLALFLRQREAHGNSLSRGYLHVFAVLHEAGRAGEDGVGALVQFQRASRGGRQHAAARAGDGHLSIGWLDAEPQRSRASPERQVGLRQADGLAGGETPAHRQRSCLALPQLDRVLGRTDGLLLERSVGLHRAHQSLVDEHLRARCRALQSEVGGGGQGHQLEDHLLLIALGQCDGLLGGLLEARLGDPHAILRRLARDAQLAAAGGLPAVLHAIQVNVGAILPGQDH